MNSKKLKSQINRNLNTTKTANHHKNLNIYNLNSNKHGGKTIIKY